MASAHIPFFLDGHWTARYRGQRYIDGSVHDFLAAANSQLLTRDGAFVVDYSQVGRAWTDRSSDIRTDRLLGLHVCSLADRLVD
jgi:hypothetical protein